MLSQGRSSAGEARGLRRSIRDLVAVSMLPAAWLDFDARQIAESLTEVLVRTMGLEFAFMFIAADRETGTDAVRVLRTASPQPPEIDDRVSDLLDPWLNGVLPVNPVEIANPLRAGTLRAAFFPFSAGIQGVIVAALADEDFPSTTQRLVLGIGANQAAIAMRRWRAEKALQILAETLEQRVALEIRERMKFEEALRAAQKLEAVGRLTGGIAHDFNNLLATVLANLELLRKRVAGEPTALRILDRAMEGAERGGALTRRLLAFARQQELRPEMIDVAELIEDLIDILQPSIGSRYQIDTAFAPDLWPVRADATQLQLALFNLAINAREAMPEGGTLTLSARNETIVAGRGADLTRGDYVCIAIADTGVGMDEDTLARAPEPFFTTKGVEKGIGLGLSVVHGVAEQSNGALRLHSRIGKGTTAELWLPRARTEGDPAQPVKAEPAAAALDDCCILLVEDDTLLRLSTAEMIRGLGHRVIEASSARQALDALSGATQVDLLITDQLMPGMLGTELIAEIRKKSPELPVILATGYSALLRGADRELPRLEKPYSEEALAEMIARVVRAGAGAAP